MSVFNIGVGGLQAAQAGLYATSNNIANVYTPGYNREIVQFGENSTGGVQVMTIERQFNQFIASRLNSAESNLNGLKAYQAQISQIDNLLSDPEAGIGPMLQRFYSAVSDLSSNPADAAAREGVLGTANSLTAQFRAFNSYLSDMQGDINGQIAAEVTKANELAKQIASLNGDITAMRAAAGQEPNMLLNQRDHAVAELSKIMDIRVNAQGDGQYNISFGNGLALVAGETATTLQPMRDAADPNRLTLGYISRTGGNIPLDEKVFTQGTLGGLMQFRTESLDKLQGQLGQMAVSMTQAYNEVHTAGFDLNGQAGEDLFTIGEPRVNSHSRNQGGAVATVSFENVAQLNSSAYDVNFANGEFTAIRRDNGQAVAVTVNPDNSISFGGLNMSFDGTPENGDRFRVYPVQDVASNFGLNITDAAKLAAATSPNSGDNTNAMELQALQNRNVVGGSATFTQAYAAIVSDTGTRISVLNANLAAQEGLADQLRMLQQAESGVNLDEEAANLMRYQQYYQANARVIQAGITIMEELLQLR
ncbi:MAG: flagellar hook-associated protein FlgK [Gammaproteobacteria bacterium]|nr:flagellar hook-associated protein FlgK [Gammaproteobacteria bacterium]